MRHLKHRSELGRTKEHRAALLANLSAALLTHGQITTTLPKAKALRPYVERIITLAKKADGAPAAAAVHLRRQAIAKVRNTDAVATLFKERVAEFKDRDGGYTRIYKLGKRRGDAADMAIIQMIAGSDEGYSKPRRGKPAQEAAPAPEAPAAEAPAAEAEAPAEAKQA